METRIDTSRVSETDRSAPCARECPTIGGNPSPLITHVIDPPACLKRQREFYHKCHRCDYRGKAADFRLEPRPPARAWNGASLNGDSGLNGRIAASEF